VNINEVVTNLFIKEFKRANMTDFLDDLITEIDGVMAEDGPGMGPRTVSPGAGGITSSRYGHPKPLQPQKVFQPQFKPQQNLSPAHNFDYDDFGDDFGTDFQPKKLHKSGKHGQKAPA
jgi:hypothetical protein